MSMTPSEAATVFKWGTKTGHCSRAAYRLASGKSTARKRRRIRYWKRHAMRWHNRYLKWYKQWKQQQKENE